MAARLLLCERPRALALVASSHVLIFRHNLVELLPAEKADLGEYRTVSYNVHGTLGLITIDQDVFLCVVSSALKTATVRPGETVQKILSVDFYCLNRGDFDQMLEDDLALQSLDTDDRLSDDGRRDHPIQHPCISLKKLLSDGSFYYSVDFDLTSRVQERSESDSPIDFDAFDKGYLWNSYMIKPLVDFRARLSTQERAELDSTKLLTSAIRGFALTMTVPAASSPIKSNRNALPSVLTLISRLSCKRAGTRFNARGIDDDGNVANFVETETIFWSPPGICMSYVQVRGSIPIFWEQQAGLLPAQQKPQVTRSFQATQPAFDKHFEELEMKYTSIHVVNLLSKKATNEVELSSRYREHVANSSLNSRVYHDGTGEHSFLQETDYDFHAETKGGRYEEAAGIRQFISESAESFGYCLIETIVDHSYRRSVMTLQQQGVFRTNCLDCLDRTNLIQTIISQMAFAMFLAHQKERLNADLIARHNSLWADNGDALSHIYAGTGAIKSSFTRSGKASLAGFLADARKSATRLYINNFADKDRQTTIDLLLGRLINQAPVYFHDPINDYVTGELGRRASEYTSARDLQLWAGTLNLNGRTSGLNEDLAPWLCPDVSPAQKNPHIVVVGFQEIVELNPQHIMSTEPTRRHMWEESVRRTLDEHAKRSGAEEYVLLRSGQLVGACLLIFVKVGILQQIRNVEASLKKTGMSGMAGNKGAVAIRFDIDNTSLCFVTAHLAAGFANYEERNRDYKTIANGLRFQRQRGIEDHDSVIWVGDFNYRIGLGPDNARQLIANRDLGRLYQNDQLNLQMMAGYTFPHYSEARIAFQPTYKYDLGTDRYDSSEKARIPAWTDRILWKGRNLRQHTYAAAQNMRFSDHRPVYGTFTCTVSVIDQKYKDRLNDELYAARRAQVDGASADDEDLIGYESVEPGLPPASSAHNKWWLEGGQPARSRVDAPGDGFVPNPSRPSNPFKATQESDWTQAPSLLD